MPFKNGWVQTIQGIKLLWHIVQNKGFSFLITRLLNQDSIENLFCHVRQYGAGKVYRPNSYQFISALKTYILNNLIYKHSSGANCQEDDNNILDNLQTFLKVENDLAPQLPDNNDNELLNVEVPGTNTETDDSNT